MFMPETPVFLARNNQLNKASRALTWLRGCPIQAKRELQQLVDRSKTESEESANQSLWQTLTKVSLIKPLIIINGFHILQILSGTYLVVFYAVDIISDMGGSDINSLQAAVLTAAVRLAFTFLYCFLLLMMPRRMMVIGSGIGSGISCLAIAIFMYIRLDSVKTPMDTYISAVFILIYIGTNTGFMTMPGIMIGELLPAKIRGRIAGNLFTIFNLLLFGVAKGFLYAKQIFKTQGLFLIFGIASFGASLLLYLMLPETKGRTLHDIEDYFQRPNWLWITRKRTAEKERRPKGIGGSGRGRTVEGRREDVSIQPINNAFYYHYPAPTHSDARTFATVAPSAPPAAHSWADSRRRPAGSGPLDATLQPQIGADWPPHLGDARDEPLPKVLALVEHLLLAFCGDSYSVPVPDPRVQEWEFVRFRESGHHNCSFQSFNSQRHMFFMHRSMATPSSASSRSISSATRMARLIGHCTGCAASSSKIFR
ncbi:sugar transporter [Culex quinquefasciatus]|uniref:Sugar transporter n=1 Tax=Culex quinquefasciatus TaxID=7176 RepID=B0W790_CULQU|nr:sugar transporter [Culex quinquefasciatus]|eukprot:XP_001844574.1 sugar transporter [Culex quinquefasciatus]